MTSLSHKTASHHRAILYVRTTGDNKIITYHSVTDMYRIVSITVNTTVLQSASSSISQWSPIRTFLIYPELTIVTCEPIVPLSEACSSA